MVLENDCRSQDLREVQQNSSQNDSLTNESVDFFHLFLEEIAQKEFWMTPSLMILNACPNG